MAKDADLDRLKAAQELAFKRQQDCWKAQEQAWQKRSAARDVLERAFQAKQSAYAIQEASWQEIQRVRNSNGPRIDQLNNQQESAFQSMKSAYERASSAWEQGDRQSAKTYSDEGKSHKADAQAYVVERRRLVEEIRSAKTHHEPAKQAFQQAKDQFTSAKSAHDRAKAEHERLQADFKQAKAEFEHAKKAFHDRLDVVKAETKRRKDDKRALAEKAGVPFQYRDNVYVSRQPDGTVSIYFGGMGSPDGPGHGHFVLSASGTVTYKRDPFDEHGAQNYSDAHRDYSEVIVSEAARSGEFGFSCRFRGYFAYVETNMNQQGRDKIDIYYGPNGPFGPGHNHAVAYRESPLNFISDEIRS